MPERVVVAGSGLQGGDGRDHLRADCSRCAALCCVAPAFAASADFALDKPAGHPCLHLQGDLRCGIHEQLRSRGFPGCAVFDCFGAGQHVVQSVLPGVDWRGSREAASAVFETFGVVRQLHEALWHLTEAAERTTGTDLEAPVAQLRGCVEDLARHPEGVDAPQVRAEVGQLLRRVSGALRAAAAGRPGPDLAGADLVGADLRTTDLRRAGLRGAYLLGADLRGVDLELADLLGADLRGVDVRGTHLAEALFLTQPQVDAARGDGATTLPAVLRRPAHWAEAPPVRRSAAAPRPDRPRRPRAR